MPTSPFRSLILRPNGQKAPEFEPFKNEGIHEGHESRNIESASSRKRSPYSFRRVRFRLMRLFGAGLAAAGFVDVLLAVSSPSLLLLRQNIAVRSAALDHRRYRS